ncbi:TIGR03618 family F420-dependent PPOX class oxidoreductase [Actinomycetospora endophytica]|uniref:TIGR03618 family F420-dependent PPOX class oxidoreductase n=1 Tax=Actinomycetospora endophytica TaxID=2291215 RepID=A0ABS8PBW8_9PSEU|nr:TIGR03618 family F420-dependent PPOX class oxidoreductase [Actinomycetospora endophytica]MCD2194484.1 TIGR03618 family F420-dependent PPOX class oxidoreductase [Actinomycetospora endophytica]
MAVTGEDLHARGEEFAEFWREYHLCSLTTLRRDGSPHVVAVGVTLDLDTATARVITRRGSQKARNVRRAEGGARVAVSQVDRGRWSTLEGIAVVREDRESVADAEARYAARYRTPRENPERVVIEIALTRVLGSR